MSATFSAAGSIQNSGCAPSVSIRLARRIACGPSRAPARLVVPMSSGTPATINSVAGSLQAIPRNPGAVAKVGTAAGISVIVYGRTRAITISARIRTMIRNSISSVRLAKLSSYSAEYVSRMIASLRSTAAFTSGTRNSSSAAA